MMRPFEMEPTWLTFPGGAIVYPHVYTEGRQLTDATPKFSITADAARLRVSGHPHDDDIETFVRLYTGTKGFITASTIGRPEVECADVPRLVAELQSLDARNINRDKIFSTCPIVSFGVSPYRYLMPSFSRVSRGEKEGESFGYTLYLHKIRISLPHEI